MLNTIKELLADPDSIYQETLQELWSGYGEISRYYIPKLGVTVIAKSVNPPQQIKHPRGWHSEISHQRKLLSYKMEANFYQYYSQYCQHSCYVPQIIAYSSSIESSDKQTLIMEDLTQLGFDDNDTTLSLSDIKVVVTWLANFHALFLQNKADDLWPIGTYWHLSTRQSEFNAMQDSPLKQAAKAIDNKLNTAKYQTIVHGDAKLANFCFGNTMNIDNTDTPVKRVAAVDFQYVGKGVGVKDLAYFLGSCLTDSDLTALHEELLDYYFKVLIDSIAAQCPKPINTEELEQEWRELYCFAHADFLRFLQGWSPEHPKINSYLQVQTDLALKVLS